MMRTSASCGRGPKVGDGENAPTHTKGMRMIKSGKRLAAVAVFAAAAVAPIAGAPSASAGTNGQQVAVSTYYSDKVYICGYNPSNNWVCSGWFNTPGTGYSELHNYWWKGTIDITGYNNDDGGYHYASCQVPVSQSGDVTYCNGRSNKLL